MQDSKVLINKPSTSFSVILNLTMRLRRLMVKGDKGEYRRSLALILMAKGMHPVDLAGMLGMTRKSWRTRSDNT
jgi:hypothetical protein